jgi:hypothetical protein
VLKVRQDLASAQGGFIDSHGVLDWQKEWESLHAYISIAAAEENFLKLKSCNQWLNLGNGNASFFHKSVKVRNASDLVKVLKDYYGNSVQDPKQIKSLLLLSISSSLAQLLMILLG